MSSVRVARRAAPGGRPGPVGRAARRGHPPRSTARLIRRAALLIGLAALLLAVRAFADPSWTQRLPGEGRDFVTLSVSVMIESLPFVFLGIAISIGVQIWLPDRVWEHLPKNPALRRMALSVLGVLFPVCECGNVPLARGLMLRGLGVSEAMTFLLAAPVLNPVTIITTYQAFGWSDGILIGRIAGAFVIANLAGWLFSRHPDPDTLLLPSFAAACRDNHDDDGQSRLSRSADSFTEETAAMLPALVAGSIIAGAIQVGIPRALLIDLGSNPVLSVLVLIVLAFIVSICSNVDAFFILSFSATFMPGAIVAFLVFGAMIDIKMLALLRTTFTTRTLVLICGLVLLCTLVLGLGLNLVT